MASLTSAGSSKSRATSKPWSLTYHDVVLVWKQGERLKLADNTSAGRVTSISVLDAKDKTVKLKGFTKDDVRYYSFSAHLESFEAGMNDFTKQLAVAVDNPVRFCQRVSETTGGLVATDCVDEHEDDTIPTTSKESRKRSSSSLPKASQPVKKGKQVAADRKDEVEKEINENEIGVFNLPVTSLREPPSFLRVREVKSWYVEYLIGMLLEDKGDHEDLTAPLLVIASVGKEDFAGKNIGRYTYEVIGGIQRFSAIKKINEMDGDRKIRQRKCAVYGNGLSRAGKLVLARQHNEFNQIQRTTSFPEMAACCRRLLFAHFSPDNTDDGTFQPDVPRYNTQDYRNFKLECLTYLVSSQVSQHIVEQAIQMALQPPAVYHKMQESFALFEEGKLKGQKVRDMTGATLMKAMEGKLAPKLSHFKIFQGLQVEQKEKLLNDIVARKISFTEAEAESKKYKGLATTKDCFLKEVGLKTWEEAAEVINKFGGEETLLTFEIKSGKPLPKNFEAFCNKAKALINAETREAQQLSPFHEDSNNVFFIANIEQVNDIDVRGSNLIFVNLSNVTTSESIESMITGLCQSIKDPWTLVLYQIPAACSSAEEVEKACNLYGAKHTRVLTLCSTVKAVGAVQLGTVREVVIGYWGKTHPPRGHILSEGPHVNSIICFPQDEDTMVAEEGTGWLNYLCMTRPRRVMDIFSESGEVAQVCKEMGLKCLVVQTSKEKAEMVMAHLGIDPAPTEREEESEEPMNTENLLDNLTKAGTKTHLLAANKSEKMVEGKSHAGKGKGTGKVPPLTKQITTRSKGVSIEWNKSINPDNPINN